MSSDISNDKIETGVTLGLAWKGCTSQVVFFTGLDIKNLISLSKHKISVGNMLSVSR